MKAFYWINVRIWFYVLVLLLLLTGGLSIIPLYPLYAWLFLNELRISRNKKFIFPIIRTAYELVYDLLLNRAYKSSFPVQFVAPPRMAPDADKVSIRADWPIAGGGCNGCSKCCSKRKCPFLNENHQCAAYGSLYWRYFNCGRYPENQQQIDYFECPKWEMRSA